MRKTGLKSIILSIALFCTPPIIANGLGPEVNELPESSVNINKADLDELDKHLKGIGKAKAKLIIKYRDEHGNFKSLEELEKVKGIGKKTVELNKDVIKL